MDVLIESSIPKKTFKQYYQDPEFKKRHLHYLTQKIDCDVCHVTFSRCNKCKHDRTQKHIQNEQIHLLKDLVKTIKN